ncbi:MAG: LVIVD repeat-containing protein [Candidatus Heimdallarchaeota archaeon]
MMKKNIVLLFLALLILWNSITLINNENFLIRTTATNQIGRKLIQQTYEHDNYTKISGYDDNIKNFVAEDILVKDDLLFIAAGDEGMIIFDITNSSSPVLVSQFYYGGSIHGVAIDDDMAYLAADFDGVQIVNISNVYKPEIIGRYIESGYFHHIYVEGNFAYVGYNAGLANGGLIILDLTSKANPLKIGKYTKDFMGRVEEITITDNYAIIIGQKSSMILDILDKSNPVEFEERLEYIYLQNSFLDGNIFYVAADIYGLLIYDITKEVILKISLLRMMLLMLFPNSLVY